MQRNVPALAAAAAAASADDQSRVVFLYAEEHAGIGGSSRRGSKRR
jgi:hypothetical protein